MATLGVSDGKGTGRAGKSDLQEEEKQFDPGSLCGMELKSSRWWEAAGNNRETTIPLQIRRPD